MTNIAFHHPRIWNWSILFLTIILSSFFFTVSSTTVHAAQVTLAWDRNAEPNVEGYKVYYGTASRDYDWFIDVGDVTSITITDLTDGFTYYFAATAYDTATPPLESTYSDEVSQKYVHLLHLPDKCQFLRIRRHGECICHNPGRLPVDGLKWSCMDDYHFRK